MKYIRTRDGRILEWGKLNETTKLVIDTEDEVISQADSIEELCDEFVLFDKQFNTYGLFDKKVITYEWLKSHIELYQEKYFTIYGAVWCEWGLKYVAKMNGKGELELL